MSAENLETSNEQTFEEQTSWETELQAAIKEGTPDKEFTPPTRTPEEEEIRKQRIQLRIQQLNTKLEELTEKYMKETDERSIKNTILKHARLGHDKVYINMNREDFTGWHTFVKGGYKNAHPRKCVHLFLRNAVRRGLLPRTLKWNIWNNQSFTIVFTIQNYRTSKQNEAKHLAPEVDAENTQLDAE